MLRLFKSASKSPLLIIGLCLLSSTCGRKRATYHGSSTAASTEAPARPQQQQETAAASPSRSRNATAAPAAPSQSLAALPSAQTPIASVVEFDAMDALRSGRQISHPAPSLHSSAKRGHGNRAPASAVESASDAQFDTDSSAIDRDIRQAKGGKFFLRAPEKMNVQDTARVSARIVLPDLSGAIPDTNADWTLSGTGLVQGQAIKVTPNMDVTLIPEEPGSFQIKRTEDSNELNHIAPGGYADWRWDVTALKDGTETLRMDVYMVFYTGVNKSRTFVKSVTQPIVVTVIHVPFYDRAAVSVWKFLVSNWKWFLSLLPASFLLWLGRLLRLGDLLVKLRDKLAGSDKSKPESAPELGPSTEPSSSTEDVRAEKKAAGSR